MNRRRPLVDETMTGVLLATFAIGITVGIVVTIAALIS